MRMITKKIVAYKLDELTGSARDRAFNLLAEWVLDCDWWDGVYMDAEMVGLKIKWFDLDRRLDCGLEFVESARRVAQLIMDNHGTECDTYKTAAAFLADYIPACNKLERCQCILAIYGHHVSSNKVYDLANRLEDEITDLENEFKRDLANDYAWMLQREYEWLSSEEYLSEHAEMNGYEFDAAGRVI